MKRTIVFLGIAGLALAGCQPVDPKTECLRYDTEIRTVRNRNGTPPGGLMFFEELAWYRENTTQDQLDDFAKIDQKYGRKLNTTDARYFCGQLNN